MVLELRSKQNTSADLYQSVNTPLRSLYPVGEETLVLLVAGSVVIRLGRSRWRIVTGQPVCVMPQTFWALPQHQPVFVYCLQTKEMVSEALSSQHS